MTRVIGTCVGYTYKFGWFGTYLRVVPWLVSHLNFAGLVVGNFKGAFSVHVLETATIHLAVVVVIFAI